MDSDKAIVTQDERKITWGLTRKVNLGNYESVDCSIYMTDFVPEHESVSDFLKAQTEAAFDMLKVEVYTALELDFAYTEDGRPKAPKKKVPEVIPGNSLTPMPASPAPAMMPGVAPVAAGPRPDRPTVAQVGHYAELPQFCGQNSKKGCGQSGGPDGFYDNRAEIDEKIKGRTRIGPDFKCKNCGNGYWRPGSFDYNEAIKGGSVPTAMMPPSF